MLRLEISDEFESRFRLNFKNYKEMLYNFISKKFYSQLLPFEVEEVVLETFEKFSLNRKYLFLKEINVAGWLMTVSRNLALDLLRKRKAKSSIQMISFDNTMEINLEMYSSGVMDTNVAFLYEYEKNVCDLISFIKNAIYSLPSPYKEFIRLHYLADISFIEINKMYPNENIPSIRRKVRKGRMILKNKFQKQYDSINQAYMF